METSRNHLHSSEFQETGTSSEKEFVEKESNGLSVPSIQPCGSRSQFSGMRPVVGARPPNSEQNSSSELEILQNALNTNGTSYNMIRRIFEYFNFEPERARRRKETAIRRLIMKEQSHSQEVQSLQETIVQYKKKLKNERETVQRLQIQVSEAHSKLNRAYSAAVSTWRADVSRDMPDDVIRNTINSFFKGDFFSWCADLSATRIFWNRVNERALQKCHFVNQTASYGREPVYLRFDYSGRNPSASLVLLQAALSYTLCQNFLKTPYFFIKYGKGLEEVEGALAKTSMEASVDWRVNTLKSLGKNASLDPEVANEMAHRFVEDFSFLLIEGDKTAFTDLVELFIQFAEIALKLWSTKTNIRVLHPTEIMERYFHVGDPYIECEPGLVTTLGEQLTGRPIGVVLRPCIMSEPIQKAGQEPSRVIWSKAMVWVSSATRNETSKH